MENSVVIARCGGMVEAEIGGELVGLDVERGSCFGFNETATWIWRLLETPRSFGSICEALVATHDVDPPTCCAELSALLTTLADEGLVTLTIAP